MKKIFCLLLISLSISSCSIFKKPDSKIFSFVKKMPEYPGGSEAMNSFIVDHLKYPTLAKDNNVEGKVIAQFVVTKTGDVTDIKILRDIGSGCGEEVMRVLKLMPKWIPGKNKRKTVDVYLTLPIEFTLAQ